MRQTLVAVFEEREAAQRAASALRDAGVAQADVQVSDGDRPRDAAQAAQHAPEEGLAAYVRSFFAEVFGPHETQHVRRYADLLERGHAVLRVTVADSAERARALQALQAAGALDIHEQPR